MRRYIDFYSSLVCDVILTSVWSSADVDRQMAAYFGYEVSEIGLHVNLSMIFCFAFAILFLCIYCCRILLLSVL